jgi:phage tail-like protein
MYLYARKSPGIPTVADVTFSRGVVLGDTKMFAWVRRAIEGGEYRSNVTYYHYHRTALPGAQVDANPHVAKAGPTSVDELADNSANVYNLYEAFAIRVKSAGDLDATGSDISLQEMDVAYEYWDMDQSPQPS